MKKKLASLTAAFTLAAACTLGITPAAAQTVPVHPNAPYGSVYTAHDNRTVTQQEINQVAYALGVQHTYHRAGKGFTSGVINHSGQHIGLEFNLNGDGTATIISAYNLNDPSSARAYNANLARTANLDRNLTPNYGHYPQPVYAQPQYRSNATDIIAGVGFAILLHQAIKNSDDHRHRHYAPPPRRYDPPRHNPRDRDRHHNPRHRDHRR